MSHHFDYPEDETLDIADAFCFAGAGSRTVFGMNTSPMHGKAVEDITFRATFPIGPDGTQHMRVEQLTGAAARDHGASGTIITPPDALVGEVVECRHGIKFFAGQRRDPFYNFIPFPMAMAKALATGAFPDFDALRPAHDDFANTTVRS